MKKFVSFIAELNLPNKLTLLRIVLVPVYLVLLAMGMNWLALIVFAAASLTDMLDGKIARKYNLITNFGKFLDPLADKFMVIGMLVVMCASPMYAFFRNVLVWVTLLVILRELAITSMRLLVASSEQKIVVAASWLGKVKTVAQIVCILVLILEPLLLFFDTLHLAAWATIAFMGMMTVWSGVSYLKSYISFIDPNE